MFAQRTAAIVCAAALGFGVYAQESDGAPAVEFSNELGSDVVNVSGNTAEFAGIYNEMEAVFTSEKVDASVTAKTEVTADGLNWNTDDFDWEIVFRPVDVLNIGFSADFFFDGSYLVIEDDNIAGGKSGSDGLTLAYTGVEGLSIAVTAPFSLGETNLFSSDKSEKASDSKTVLFNIGLGASYAIDSLGSIGVTVRDVLNNDTRGFGVYAAFTGVEGLALYGGYAYNDLEGICDTAGTHLVNFSAAYETGAFNAGVDYVTAAGDIFYAAVIAGYNVTDAVNVSLTGTANAAYEKVGDGIFCAKPAVTYNHEILGEFVIEADISFTGGEFDTLCFPLSWKYSF